MAIIIIESTPNQTGSKPREVMSGKETGRVRRSRGNLIHDHADDEIAYDDTYDDEPAVKPHFHDRGDHLLRDLGSWSYNSQRCWPP